MVAVLDKSKNQINPCHPAKARWLLKHGYATIHKYFPFTIRLKCKIENINNKEYYIKLDPGAKTTGVAVVRDDGYVVLLSNLKHRGDIIHEKLLQRKAFRRARRNRKTRYRKCKFPNKLGQKSQFTSNRPEGYLPPSIKSIVDNITNLCRKLSNLFPITKIYAETVRFDTQLIDNPNIQGVEYSQGTLLGYEIREYLLYKYGHVCQYCNGLSNDNTLEIEHIHPKSRGGVDSIRNLTIACHSCNQEKDNYTLQEWLEILKIKKDKLSLKRIECITNFLKNNKKPNNYKDTAKVNSSRKVLLKELYVLGKEVIVSTGGVTKYNRTTVNLPKEHYYDALCVKKTMDFKFHKGIKCLEIKSIGRGTRSRTLLNKYGFPRAYLPRQKYFYGFMSGDIIKSIVTKGKHQGVFIGTIACRSNGYFNINTGKEIIQGISYKYCKVIQRNEGYNYRLENSK